MSAADRKQRNPHTRQQVMGLVELHDVCATRSRCSATGGVMTPVERPSAESKSRRMPTCMLGAVDSGVGGHGIASTHPRKR